MVDIGLSCQGPVLSGTTRDSAFSYAAGTMPGFDCRHDDTAA